jgi:micrococcal nuclease
MFKTILTIGISLGMLSGVAVSASAPKAPKKVNATYLYCMDGDTARFKMKNKQMTVRFVNIDTPESVKRGVKVQPYAKAASDFTKKTLKNSKKVQLQYDRGAKRDKYGRELMYVYVDGKLLQEKLVLNGYARVANVQKKNNLYLPKLQKCEKKAKAKKIKIWSKKGYVGKYGFNDNTLALTGKGRKDWRGGYDKWL